MAEEEKEESKLIHFYRIYSKSHPELGTYIGSTSMKLQRRISEHKYNYKRDGYCSSKHLFIYDDAKYELIESKNCTNKERLFYERTLIENTTNCINERRPIRTKEEKKLYEKQYDDERKEQRKEYTIEHKEQRKEYYKKYIAEHKEQRKEYQKKYKAERNKIENICVCGTKYTINHKARHERSNKHQLYVNQNPK